MATEPPDPNGGGQRQQRAAQIRAEQQAAQRQDEVAAGGEAQDEQRGTGPVGQGEYEVQEGDCISSIARSTGHFWGTIWNDSGNSALREARGDPNVLLRQDRVHVPEVRKKYESGETEMRHRFRRFGEPAMLRLRLLDEDQRPRANLPYVLEIDGEQHEGTTDADGRLQARIPGNARLGRLTVGETEAQEHYDLKLGEVDPITEVSGVQGRLKNLGYDPGGIDGELGPKTESALRRFQQDKELEETGEPDPATRDALRQDHGH